MSDRSNETDIKFMKEALRQAKKGIGRTSPNPTVGAVIVKNGKVIAKGYHRKAGLPHAEIEALSLLGGNAQGCCLYVTLEPCNHQGKTPPCTDVILKSGIRRLVFGIKDPNPNVTGGGGEYLVEKGVDVKSGVLSEECRRLNEAYIKFITSKNPFVIMKSALTLDGWTATMKGDSKWITNESSRRFVHRLRDSVDAIMVGVGTILKDDPRLTPRIARRRGKNTLRVVLDTNLKIPLESKILKQDSYVKTLIVMGDHVSHEHREIYERDDVSTVACPTKSGRIDLKALMGILGRMAVSSVLVEGGATVIGSLLRERLIDKFYIFKAPKIMGGNTGVPMAYGLGADIIDDCLIIKDLQLKRYGDDILIVGYPDYR